MSWKFRKKKLKEKFRGPFAAPYAKCPSCKQLVEVQHTRSGLQIAPHDPVDGSVKRGLSSILSCDGKEIHESTDLIPAMMMV